MTIWTTTSEAANSSTLSVRKTRAASIPISIPGLKPGGVYTIKVNDTDMTWAARQPGTRMGSGLQADSGGWLEATLMVEVNPVTGASSGERYHTITVLDPVGNVKAVTVMTQKLVGK
jgi:hypothetical protein